VTISCQPDERPPQPVRPWKSGRVHLAEGSNVVVLELPYSTEFGHGRAVIWRMEIKHVAGYSPMSLVFKNFMTHGSQGFVGQSSPNLAHMYSNLLCLTFFLELQYSAAFGRESSKFAGGV